MNANAPVSNDTNMKDFDDMDDIPRRKVIRPPFKNRWLPAIHRNDNKYRITKRTLEHSHSTKKHEKKAALLTLLNRDCRFLIFDAIIDQESTVKITPGLHHNGVIKSLSQVSRELNNEIKEWSRKRPDLTQSQTFGLYNPFLTSFDFCFIATNPFEQDILNSIIRRVYHPTAAIKHLELLELWQQSMNRLDDEKKYKAAWISAEVVWSREYKGGEAVWVRINRSAEEIRISLGQHHEDGVRDVLVLDRTRYGSLVGAKALTYVGPNLGWEVGKQAYAWTDDRDGFLEQRRIVEHED
ncbi:hypothetical protein EG329_002454 [Mollisiaceae sp. DMI_Dod_QoI]|nr:hypothetical protein EG329_002454 [Helotiales sp. DMI_Dod_QoI]